MWPCILGPLQNTLFHLLEHPIPQRHWVSNVARQHWQCWPPLPRLRKMGHLQPYLLCPLRTPYITFQSTLDPKNIRFQTLWDNIDNIDCAFQRREGRDRGMTINAHVPLPHYIPCSPIYLLSLSIPPRLAILHSKKREVEGLMSTPNVRRQRHG